MVVASYVTGFHGSEADEASHREASHCLIPTNARFIYVRIVSSHTNVTNFQYNFRTNFQFVKFESGLGASRFSSKHIISPENIIEGLCKTDSLTANQKRLHPSSDAPKLTADKVIWSGIAYTYAKA